MEKHFVIIASFALASILALIFRLYGSLVAAPRRLRRTLLQQGVGGPPPAFLLGNISDIKKSRTAAAAAAAASPAGAPASHNCGAAAFPLFFQWRRRYGDMYTFWLGNMPVLVVNKYDVIKEVLTCTSLDLAKPTSAGLDVESLFGNGILNSNGKVWAHQRKILAPELFAHKVKGMTNLIQESTLMLIDSWKGLIDGEGGKADIKIDSYLIKFSGEVISRACFGSSYAEGEKLFQKFSALQKLISKKGFSLGILGMRYVPTKNNRRSWELQREVRELILELVKEKNEANIEKNMLRMILEGAQSNPSQDAVEKFTIDNCKSIYFAGFDTTATSASWCLMLLATNPQWQHRVREEVIGICRGKSLDYDSLTHMKQLTMVINETLRLYPPAGVVAREALNEIEFAGTHIPKGVNIWIMIIALQTDPDIWGEDSYQFKPERFANGTSGACKLPQLFMPFGIGPRICLGQTLAMVELKILLAYILLNFSFSLSPKYVHAPTLNLSMGPGYGVDLVIEKLN